MLKVQVNYITERGERKSKSISYANPEASNFTLKEFANALYALSTNSVEDIYKIENAELTVSPPEQGGN